MKGLAVTHHGIEEVTSQEINELIGVSCKVKEGCAVFDFDRMEDLCLLCYKAQSVTRIINLLAEFKFTSFDDLVEKIKNVKIDSWLRKTFQVKCSRIGEHPFNSQDVEKAVGENINGMVDFDNPDVLFFVYIYNDNAYFGVDFAGFDLAKRDYKIFSHPISLKGPLAYSIVRLAKYKEGEVLLDPFCKDGTVAVEAALFASRMPVNFYRKKNFAFSKFVDFDFGKADKAIKDATGIHAYDSQMRNVEAAKKNAKIAGVNKFITFSKMDTEWLDTKLDKASVDKIVTNLPRAGKENVKFIERLYKEFFYQAEFVLKDKGLIVCVTNNTDILKKYADEYKFKAKETKEILGGQLKAVILTK